MIYLFLDWERINSLEIERKYDYQAYESSPPKVQDSTRQSKLDLFVIKFVDLDLITFFFHTWPNFDSSVGHILSSERNQMHHLSASVHNPTALYEITS